MIPLAEIYLLSAFVSLIVGVLIYGQNATHAVNRMFIVVCGVLFYYEFTEFEFLQAGDVNVAFQWLRLAAFWYLLPVAVFHLCIVYANFRVRRLVLASMYGAAVFFSLFEFFLAPYELFKMPWGWAYRYASYYGYVQVLWVILPNIAALLVLIKRYHDVKSREEKTGVAYVLSGVLIPIVTGISVTVLPFLTSIDLPDLTTPAAAIGFLLVGYAVFRYGIHILTASAATDDILSTMVDALFLVDKEGEIIVSNKAASRLLEFETSELTGKQLNTITKDSKIMEDFLGNNSPSSLETDFKTKQEHLIPVSVSKSAVVTKRGNLVGYVLVCRDITERKKMEERLLNAERMATIGETTSMVGHDLRNPLQVVVSTLYLAKKKLGTLPESFRENLEKSNLIVALETIENEAQYMNKIVSDLQSYAAPMNLDLTHLDIREFVEDILSQLDIPGNIKTILTAPDSPPSIMIDKSLMRRALTNLIMNAFQAMPDGGELRIMVSKTDRNLRISFIDTGVGIPKENMGRLFKPLFTTKAKGQGFGLAVCKRVVEAHDGSMAVVSEPGQGSTFTIELPLER
ncbi:MAG: ATP-binding protein [Candidatus Bathyarchaeia archaeon]|jgi:PAS domain S-box-containing protein